MTIYFCLPTLHQNSTVSSSRKFHRNYPGSPKQFYSLYSIILGSQIIKEIPAQRPGLQYFFASRLSIRTPHLVVPEVSQKLPGIS